MGKGKIELEKMEQLLEEFKALPPWEHKPTFMEICKYPGRRFEEICSRILAFYFNSDNPHNLGTTILESFFECIEDKSTVPRFLEHVNINVEEPAEGKRIDLLIYNSEFVLGIENKITAELYNNLSIYKERIESYKKTKTFKIVLSVHSIRKKNERKSIEKNDFENITYSQFFKKLRSKINIDNHKIVDNEYLTYLLDFMKTLEKMTRTDQETKNHDYLFRDKYDEIQKLIKPFQNYIDHHNAQRNHFLSELTDKLKKEDENWWLLGGNNFGLSKGKIGIQAWFENEKQLEDNKLLILFRYWDMDSPEWASYKELFEKENGAPSLGVTKENFVIAKTIECGNQGKIKDKLQEEIIICLNDCYDKVNKVIEQGKKLTE